MQDPLKKATHSKNDEGYLLKSRSRRSIEKHRYASETSSVFRRQSLKVVVEYTCVTYSTYSTRVLVHSANVEHAA